jgi:hypothetical protein
LKWELEELFKKSKKRNMKTQTYKQQQIQKFASNRRTIEKALGLTTDEYNQLQFEFGCKYLEDQYPANSEYEQYYKQYAYSSKYWSWWKLEWALWEEDLLQFAQQHRFPLSLKSYKMDYMHPRTINRMDSSFHNQFLKYFEA